MRKILPVYHLTEFCCSQEDPRVTVGNADMIFNPGSEFALFASLMRPGDQKFLYRKFHFHTYYSYEEIAEWVKGKSIQGIVSCSERYSSTSWLTLPGFLCESRYGIDTIVYALVYNIHHEQEVLDQYRSEGTLHQEYVKLFADPYYVSRTSSQKAIKKHYRDHIWLDAWKQRIEIIEQGSLSFLKNRYIRNPRTISEARELDNLESKQFTEFVRNCVNELSQEEIGGVLSS